ncbi:MAG: ferrous iron transport protein A [Candidatus Margulisbacteria bacterium]|nr:ferrous iron transport protein A [Candidatus Margulisiibacteriota bacterium]MBU1022377.1 ferrous iron transport protein A [Candidatus Margulisiibacteriota bacterium]MBU1729071.1 ferrous iron transport protein A [Candidatus Margulisiibacteriota bacterium]MBU1954508.1 ferrous iron transport protein A [Candidatus Margulisiibacteriota bacterium]
MNPKEVSVTSMRSGQSGVVTGIAGGHEVSRRLQAMGVKTGKPITKVSGMFFWGPVTVRVGHTQLSIGHGMASKIMVEVAE